METGQLPTLYADKCTGCGICETCCPTGAIRLDPDSQQPHFVEPLACSYCGICEEICPAGAVELVYTILPLSPKPPREDKNHPGLPSDSNPSEVNL